jgi:hypothetical protein
LYGAVPAGDGVGGFFSAADGCLKGAHGAPYALGGPADGVGAAFRAGAGEYKERGHGNLQGGGYALSCSQSL